MEHRIGLTRVEGENSGDSRQALTSQKQDILFSNQWVRLGRFLSLEEKGSRKLPSLTPDPSPTLNADSGQTEPCTGSHTGPDHKAHIEPTIVMDISTEKQVSW